MLKSKALASRDGQNIEILCENPQESLKEILKTNRAITEESFFSPSISNLHDPYLMPDMEHAVKRIFEAREKQERVVIFGDYDVDGVSSTALLYTFFTAIGIKCSYRLPHRVHDGYGVKKYHFDELAEKNVKLVITVDCGTRDIEPIEHAKSLGIDVIVTDHHAVPEIIPAGVPILNPKRKDSRYPYSGLAGAGVAFTLVRGICEEMKNIGLRHRNKVNSSEARREGLLGEGSETEYDDPGTWIASCLGVTDTKTLEKTILSYIDLASLGTVADCMPLTGENRIITALGLRQMKQSKSSALRKYIENLDREVDGDADIIGFQIGPRINAAGRMDSPLTALHWLISDESRVDDWLEEVESLNTKRQEAVKKFREDALISVNPDDPILFYFHEELEHGLIGLIAGKLTEAYGKPSIVLCPHREDGKREYEEDTGNGEIHKKNLVASCRSPEWCNLVELLDGCKEYFVRYGGHRQAAGFTIEDIKYKEFQKTISEKFSQKYDTKNLPKKTIKIECILDPKDITLDSLNIIDIFRPFGIGNPKPIFLMENLTVKESKTIGKENSHLSLTFYELPGIKCLLWNFSSILLTSPSTGDIISPIFTLDRNIWNGKESVQMMIQNFLF